MRKKINSYNLLKQIILPFLVFIVIPMILLNCAIFQLLNALRQEEYQRNLYQLEDAGDYLSNILEESISISRKMFFDHDFQLLAYVTADLETEDYAKIRTLDNILHKYYQSSNNEKFSLHVYYTQNNILLSTDGSCHDLSYFYDKSYKIGDYSLMQINTMALEADYNIQFHAEENIMANGKSYEGFFYTTALNHPVGEKQSKGVIISIFHCELLNDIFKSLNENGGFSYITDRNGALLSVIGENSLSFQTFLPSEIKGYVPEEIYGKGYTASYVCLPEGINIYNVKPASEVIRNTQILTFLALILNITTVIICAFIIISISKRRLQKLSRIFSMLDLSTDKTNKEYHDSLDHAIATLVNKNHSLNDSLTRNVFLLRSEFWNRLLQGDFSSEQEMWEYAASSDINLTADFFCLLIISIKQECSIFDTYADSNSENETMHTYHKLLSDYLEAKTVLQGYVHNISVQQTLICLRISQTDTEHYRQYIENLLDDFPTPPQDINVRCVGSRLFDSAFSVRNEYNYCCNVLLRYYEALHSDKSIFVWGKKEYSQRVSLYFPQKLSEQIINSILAGDKTKVARCFSEVFSHNFDSDHSVTSAASDLLMIRIKIIMMEAYKKEMDFDLHKRFQEIDRLSYDAAKISYFIKLAEEMCSYYQENIDQKTEKLRQKIITYINENYASINFSLKEVAAHCGFSDSYFSILFREIMHIGFSSYVERLKMETADQLLLETPLKIEEISMRVGYSDDNAFRRAYKKYYAISPSQRREQKQKITL